LSSLAGRCAIVAGVDGRLGLAAARALAGHGATVFGVDRDAAALDQLPAGVVPLACDMSDGAIREVIARVEREGGTLDIVVTCPPAAAEVSAPPDATALHGLMQTFVEPALSWTAAAAAVMAPRRAGAIVHVTGLAGLGGWRGRSAAGAAFAAIHNLVQNFAVELAPKEVRVNALAAGVDPHEVARIAAAAGLSDRDVLARIPLGFAMPESAFADALIYLAHPGSTYVSGQVLAVDGGWSTWGRLHAVAS
jgi:NAD(P)-dependent dehydrogenase (short-subunit alcohol dehydrogenase family)